MKKLRYKLLYKLFPNIPVISLIFELNQALSDCSTVLDLGCGELSHLRFLRFDNAIGIDVNKDTIKKAKENKIHKYYYLSDVKNVKDLFSRRQFDACVALDLIEHLSKKDGAKLINDMSQIALKKVVIFTPNGYLPQKDKKNKYNNHVSGWKVDEIRKIGFKVIGMFGHKTLRGKEYKIRFQPKLFWGIISELTQYFYSRWKPETAAGLFCIKSLKK